MYLKDNIKKIRSLSNLNQTDFAEVFGVTLDMQKSYEVGRARPDAVYIDRLSKRTGISVDDLDGKKMDVEEIEKAMEPLNKIIKHHLTSVIGGANGVKSATDADISVEKNTSANASAVEIAGLRDRVQDHKDIIRQQFEYMTKMSQMTMQMFAEQLAGLREEIKESRATSHDLALSIEGRSGHRADEILAELRRSAGGPNGPKVVRGKAVKKDSPGDGTHGSDGDSGK